MTISAEFLITKIIDVIQSLPIRLSITEKIEFAKNIRLQLAETINFNHSEVNITIFKTSNNQTAIISPSISNKKEDQTLYLKSNKSTAISRGKTKYGNPDRMEVKPISIRSGIHLIIDQPDFWSAKECLSIGSLTIIPTVIGESLRLTTLETSTRIEVKVDSNDIISAKRIASDIYPYYLDFRNSIHRYIKFEDFQKKREEFIGLKIEKLKITDLLKVNPLPDIAISLDQNITETAYLLEYICPAHDNEYYLLLVENHRTKG